MFVNEIIHNNIINIEADEELPFFELSMAKRFKKPREIFPVDDKFIAYYPGEFKFVLFNKSFNKIDTYRYAVERVKLPSDLVYPIRVRDPEAQAKLRISLTKKYLLLTNGFKDDIINANTTSSGTVYFNIQQEMNHKVHIIAFNLKGEFLGETKIELPKENKLSTIRTEVTDDKILISTTDELNGPSIYIYENTITLQ